MESSSASSANTKIQKQNINKRSTDGEVLGDHETSKTLLRFVTLGSVDDGKSTLIGRLLYDSNNLHDDQMKKLEESKLQAGLKIVPDFSLVTDGLLAEQEQKITIDVAYRYFRTEKRVFILADSPGHEQYTRNMATAASSAQVALLLIDARNGITTQTRRHAFIASLLGIKRIIVLLNKMDLVDYSEERFAEVVAQFLDFAGRLQFVDIQAIPVSALLGDNVVRKSDDMPWYSGPSLLSLLESLYISNDENPIDFRYPVQYVIRPHQDYRGFAGQIVSGRVHVGDEVVVLPSGISTRVKSIDMVQSGVDGVSLASLDMAHAPQSVTIRLDDEVDASRGNMIVRVGNVPDVVREVEANLVWLTDTPLDVRKNYLVQHCSRLIKGRVAEVRYKIDVNTIEQRAATSLAMNEVGRAHMVFSEPLFADAYEKNRTTGSFILIDPDTFMTTAAGMILDRKPAKSVLRTPATTPKSLHLHDEVSKIGRKDRELSAEHRAATFWFTGLSGSGKSSLCRQLELQLFNAGKRVYWLDGDVVRKGLCRDLGFTREERRENLRRIAEVAKLFNDAGIIVLCSFITPYHADQELVREVVGEGSFHLVYLSTPLEVCEERDPNGLYAKARKGEIAGFTGVDAPYEVPEKPECTVDTASGSLAECTEKVWQYVIPKVEIC